ncbi:MAG: exodeoxyribonuclease III, partial [Chromatiales bacterium]|nr:exodeoxyribonuclease III [Chromatiales bacterium]
MRIMTLNANGIRAAVRKGFPDWLAGQSADFVCLQEVRAQEQQLDEEAFWPAGYFCQYREAAKAGYSGVAVYSRWTPDAVVDGIGMEAFDNEGRYLEFQVENLSVVSLYLPSGTSGEVRLKFKYECMDAVLAKFQSMMGDGRDYVVCG